jgi:hypothetical protein
MIDEEELDPLSEEIHEDPLEESEIPDAASPSGLRKAERKSRQKKDQSAEFWKEILSTAIGRQEIWTLLSEAHAFETRFACGPSGFPQPDATWFHAGQQDFGLRLYQKLLAISPTDVLQMHREWDYRFIPSKPRRTKLAGD